MSQLRPSALFSSLVAAASLTACAQTVQDPTGSSTTATTQALATDADAGARPPHRHEPPPEAFNACSSKTKGDACTVTFDDHTMQGKCNLPPPDTGDTRLVCFPDGPPPGAPPGSPHGGPRRPPPEAFDACKGKGADATCSVTTPHGTLDGACKGPPPGVDAGADAPLACVPAKLPPPPPPH